ncbi:MAG: hypothetical protein EXS17_06810 [Phycisphaerales bacterium]|nr:hypothetical protein [Phycisphaerales bacterium]
MGETIQSMKMVFLLVPHGHSFDAVINAVLDAGISDATVVEARNLAAIMQQDLPIFAGLAALLPQASGTRAILALCRGDRATTLMTYLREIPKDDRPIAVVITVENFLGSDS